MDVTVDSFQRGVVDHWANCCWRVEAIADLELLDAIEQQLGERPAHGVVHDDSARSRAPLAAGAKRAPHDAIDREREVGVVEHDNRVLAAHLQRAAFTGFDGCYGYAMSDLVRAGERDQPHVAMTHERIADLRAPAEQEIQHTRRQARFNKGINELRGATGVSLEGFHTTVLPSTNAGKIFQLGTAMGKFHGVMTATTPIGSRTLMQNLSGSSLGVV